MKLHRKLFISLKHVHIKYLKWNILKDKMIQIAEKVGLKVCGLLGYFMAFGTFMASSHRIPLQNTEKIYPNQCRTFPYSRFVTC